MPNPSIPTDPEDLTPFHRLLTALPGGGAMLLILLLSQPVIAERGDAGLSPDEIDYTEIPVDRMDEELQEHQYPETWPDRFSDGTEDPRTVYRDMGDRYDTEAMVTIRPGQDPDRVLPEPTVVPVDHYSDTDSVVTPAGVIRMREPGPEDIIFEQINKPAQPPRMPAPDAAPAGEGQRGAGRVILPGAAPKPAEKEKLIEILSTDG